MPKARSHRARIRFALAIPLLSATPAALAQYPSSATVQELPRGDDPAELLAQALRTLATEPNNVPALIAAGHNALVLGDPNAAVGFFGRASELAPRDGQVKAGLGSALIQLEKPADALRLFGEASALGVPDADLAEDRGLAYDLSGDTRRAQRDYAMVLAAHPDDDTARRRLALSQGIAGDKAGALATLDPLIRRRDIAGWRAQTFVLAMNGDAAGAGYITHIMMPQQADRLQPFLVRLATLSPADKARAVHFGEMPQAGAYTSNQLASTGAPATYAGMSPAATPAASDTPPKRPRHATRVAVAEPDEDMPERSAPAPRETPAPPKREVAVAAAAPRQQFVAPVPASTPVPTPNREVATPTPTPTSAPPPRHEITVVTPTPVPAPTPSTPQRVTVAAGAPATGTRFIGPPADLAPKEASAATPAQTATTEQTQTALVTTPAPLAETAFATAQPPSPSPTPAPLSSASPPADANPAAAPPSIVVPRPLPTSPSTVTTASGTPAASLPVPAASGHFDLPHDAAGPPAPPVRKSTAPAPEMSAAAAVAAAPRSLHAGTRSTEAAAVRKDETTASPEHEMSKSGKASGTHGRSAKAERDADVEDSKETSSAKDRHTSARKGKADDTTGRAAKADRDADDDRTTDSSSTKGKHGATRKGKADDATSDEGGKTRSGKAGRKANASSDDDDRDSKSAKDRSGKSGDSAAGKKHGKAAGKKDEESSAPRVYVQVAGGANKEDMDKAWEGVKKKAPDLMRGHTPSTTPLKATNRLLVGPFKSDEEAQAFVNKMAGKGLSGFTFKSAKGQKVEKVDTGK